jgi:uncharacterized membrane protein YgaE (UPF0421/DUF939 family)
MKLQRVIELRDRWSQRLGAQSSGQIGLSYALRTTCAALASWFVCRALGIPPIWAMVSSVVVILPSHKASVASAALRVIANLVGAGVGIAIAAIGLPAVAALVLGLLLVAALCRLLAIDGAARSASVGFLIVSLRGESVLGSSETRIAQVALGCAIAFVITLIAARIER